MTVVQFAPRCPARPFDLSPQERYRQSTGLNLCLNRPLPCEEELHFGFFFDGTRNNADNDRPRSAQSNVARLFDLFNIEPKQSELKRYRFRSYAAGVGTPFYREVGDVGIGIQSVAGAATGWRGEARIGRAVPAGSWHPGHDRASANTSARRSGFCAGQATSGTGHAGHAPAGFVCFGNGRVRLAVSRASATLA
ncbi:phospholipase effector Tle1 domain-containing protein [Cupriavidus nantongensis]|uniref:phospholipase effector Tle1 domain-containing protein n=1 Tax=Cupriavidus nantongensis TaxID=1796606 RepID=UPI002244FC99|nr:DUF2235 domain-containing protein [Cupriavidus nantongensis]